jgi:hypothetical protein
MRSAGSPCTEICSGFHCHERMKGYLHRKARFPLELIDTRSEGFLTVKSR